MNKKTFFASSLALAGTALAISTATPANALTFNWSFVASPNSSGQVGQTISGTISGLVEGFNDAADVTVTVLSTPTGELTGGGWIPTDPGFFFEVTGGVITDFDAVYVRNGGEEGLDFGTFGGLLPQLIDLTDDVPDWQGASITTFTPAGTATTPEPGSVVALLGLGALGLVGRKLKR